jgi:hypothetical protein
VTENRDESLNMGRQLKHLALHRLSPTAGTYEVMKVFGTSVVRVYLRKQQLPVTHAGMERLVEPIENPMQLMLEVHACWHAVRLARGMGGPRLSLGKSTLCMMMRENKTSHAAHVLKEIHLFTAVHGDAP